MMRGMWLASGGAVLGFVAAALLLPTAQGAVDHAAFRQLDLFGDAFERVRANYVREVEDKELISGAIQGMVSSLDPHSSYLDPESFTDMQVQTRGEFGGLGIEVTSEDGFVKVVAPIDDTPAARAGIEAGDLISAIDGESLQGLPLSEAIDKMRGPANSTVELTVLRAGETKPLSFTITRAIIRVESVRFERKDDIGYIRVTTFNEKALSGLERAMRELAKGGELRGYVLDLRNNPGGLLDQGISIADAFLNTGQIVSTRGRKGVDIQPYSAKRGDLAAGKPVVVLVNGGSASASEIVAGALQDHKRATVVGTQSFGKGSVQTIIPLGGELGGALRLTTAKYYTPSGRSIQALGIRPDYEVAQTAEPDEAETAALLRRSESSLRGHLEAEGVDDQPHTIIRPEKGAEHEDFQLEFALELLRTGKSLGTAAALQQ